MNVHLTYVNFKADPETIELAYAADALQIEADVDVHAENLQHALDAYGDEILNRVTVAVEIPPGLVADALRAEVTTAATTVSIVGGSA